MSGTGNSENIEKASNSARVDAKEEGSRKIKKKQGSTKDVLAKQERLKKLQQRIQMRIGVCKLDDVMKNVKKGGD